ncbi:MAG TPA: APC family permease, partial [Chloroflexota bacterium]|nr:APC family permease [Chloroflexota bacterium]
SILGLIAWAFFRLATGGIPYTPGPAGPRAGTETLTRFLVLSAFAKGCTAMTGTEAISNVVPVFKEPEIRNARITLGMMAGLLAVMFVGISFLASHIGIIPDPTESETVLSQLTRLTVGDGPYYYLITVSTTLILVLAANTSYASFPRLLYVMARDRYVPRWFGLRGDRLAFNVGIFALTFFACALLAFFGSNVERLLPLYAIGVFTGFTLSQSGMVLHWLRGTEPNRQKKAAINGVGAVVTAIVAMVIAVTKFEEGAWIVILIAPVLIALFLTIHGHYVRIAKQLHTQAPVKPRGTPPLVLVPISSLSLVARQAMAFAEDLSKRVVAIHVTSDLSEAETLKAQWHDVVGEVPLVIIESPYRLLLPPLLAYVDAVREMDPDETIMVVLPEFVPRHWWENLLHNQTALRMKGALLFRSRVAVTSFPYQLAE